MAKVRTPIRLRPHRTVPQGVLLLTPSLLSVLVPVVAVGQVAADPAFSPETNEARFQGLLLLTMIILLGLVGIFIVLGLMTAWRKGHRLQRRVEQEVSKRRGPVAQVDTWRIAGERTAGPVAAAVSETAQGQASTSAEVLEDGETELLDPSGMAQAGPAEELPAEFDVGDDDAGLPEDMADDQIAGSPTDGGTPELTSESGPPRFDTGVDYDDGYEDDDAEVDTGDHWKQGTDYDPALSGPEPLEDLEDDEQDPFRRYRASEQDEFSDLDDPLEDDDSL